MEHKLYSRITIVVMFPAISIIVILLGHDTMCLYFFLIDLYVCDLYVLLDEFNNVFLCNACLEHSNPQQ